MFQQQPKAHPFTAEERAALQEFSGTATVADDSLWSTLLRCPSCPSPEFFNVHLVTRNHCARLARNNLQTGNLSTFVSKIMGTHAPSFVLLRTFLLHLATTSVGISGHLDAATSAALVQLLMDRIIIGECSAEEKLDTIDTLLACFSSQLYDQNDVQFFFDAEDTSLTVSESFPLINFLMGRPKEQLNILCRLCCRSFVTSALAASRRSSRRRRKWRTPATSVQ